MRKEDFVKRISILTFGSIVSSACADEIMPTPDTAADNPSSPTVEVNATVLPATAEVFEMPIKISPTPIPTDVFIEPTVEAEELLKVAEIPYDANQTIAVLEHHNPSYGVNDGEYGPAYMTTEVYEGQLVYLKENDFYTPSEDELLGWLEGKHGLPRKSVIIRIDIGLPKKDYEEGFRLLEDYGFRSLFVHSNSPYT